MTKHVQDFNTINTPSIRRPIESKKTNSLNSLSPTLTTITQNNQHQIDSDSANYSAPEMKSRPQTRSQDKEGTD